MTGAPSSGESKDEENYETLKSKLRTLNFHPKYQERTNQIIQIIEKYHWEDVEDFVDSIMKELSRCTIKK